MQTNSGKIILRNKPLNQRSRAFNQVRTNSETARRYSRFQSYYAYWLNFYSKSNLDYSSQVQTVNFYLAQWNRTEAITKWSNLQKLAWWATLDGLFNTTSGTFSTAPQLPYNSSDFELDLRIAGSVMRMDVRNFQGPFVSGDIAVMKLSAATTAHGKYSSQRTFFDITGTYVSATTVRAQVLLSAIYDRVGFSNYYFLSSQPLVIGGINVYFPAIPYRAAQVI